jgi:hypothetical protein
LILPFLSRNHLTVFTAHSATEDHDSARFEAGATVPMITNRGRASAVATTCRLVAEEAATPAGARRAGALHIPVDEEGKSVTPGPVEGDSEIMKAGGNRRSRHARTPAGSGWVIRRHAGR